MGVTMSVSTEVGDHPIERLTELVDSVLETAQQLKVSAVAARTRTGPSPAPTRSAMCAALIADLLSGQELDGREVSLRAAELGCDLSLGALVLCVELLVPKPAFVKAMIADGCSDALVSVFAPDSDSIDAPRIYAVLPATGACIAGSVGGVRLLAARMASYGVVGLSSYQAQPEDLGRAFREAELVLGILRHTGISLAEEIGSGTYRLLLRMLATHPAELCEFYDSTLAAVVDYDMQNQTELVATLRAYLEADCNMNATAGALDAHRHTVAARLERIRELTGFSPLRCEDRERLGLGLKVHRLLAPQLAG
jgi:hypothetical protein